MARKKTSPFEDVIDIVSKLPWWLSTILALISYFYLHALASQPPTLQTALITLMATFGQYLLPLALCVGAAVSAFNAVKQKKLYEGIRSRTDVSSLTGMSWDEFEVLVGEHFKRCGFDVSRQGGSGPDGGIDLILRKGREKHLVQCKQWKAYKVSVQPVREFYGVMAAAGAAGGYFVTSGTFTEDAKAFVRGLSLELIDGNKLKSMIGGVTKVTSEPFSARFDPPVAPQCPKCGAAMQMRVARKGANAGQKFWGCSTYPKCNGTQIIRVSDSAPAPQDTATVQPKEEWTMTCPVCGSELVLRKFQSGPREGQNFYGCLPCKKAWPIGSM